MHKIDLHTHSEASADGGLTLLQYEQKIHNGSLQQIAITDHNRIDFAVQAHKKLGDVIIVGEEIMTTEGEVIGLFLRKLIEPYKSLQETVLAIKNQGGIVYIPHPFETMRSGVSEESLEKITDQVDIIEVYNGRAMQRTAQAKALAWAKAQEVAAAASSDAHGGSGWGRTYTSCEYNCTSDTIVDELSRGQLMCKDVGMIGRLYPTLHRTRKKITNHA